ncbi:MAG: division/cell wall cluster transcriptional repressor MraZ [Desulfobulbaceae bacterium]|nr:MAG: division/cell wall cluster transcriptional repressor MraZ [Desulfobulbaceae bacterium]
MDEKGRINIATRFRDVLRQQDDQRLMITPWKTCLRAYPLPVWEKLETRLIAEGRKHPQQVNLMRYVIGGVLECGLDRQGRILLPPNLREECKLKRDVVVNGMITHFEIWDKDIWEQVSRPSNEQFAAFEQTWLELGLS